MAKLIAWARQLAGRRGFPLALALLAIVLMLPTLPTGLVWDDLIQRLQQLTPAELPPGILDTGVVSSDSGTFTTVVLDLFNYSRLNEATARGGDFGALPWWVREDTKIALLRPVTAFTHWLDYRLFPNKPALMHAHSNLWFALVILLAGTLYRRIAMFPFGGATGRGPAESGASRAVPPAIGAAGLAAVLFLLDKDTYVPAMYVANRGFFIALVFGLLSFEAHHRWRTEKSRGWMWLSALCLLLSLLADEGGASTLAFLVAYALVLEPRLPGRSAEMQAPASTGAKGDQSHLTSAATGFGIRNRLASAATKLRHSLVSLVPAALVVVSWRVVYVASGYGVRNILLYIDPGYEPWLFLKHLVPRAIGLLGGQLTGVPPEIAVALSTTGQILLALFFAGCSLLCAVVFLPVIRRDTAGRFWAVVTVLALVPAATVAPLSKNLGFVALGAFGVIASFLVRFAAREERVAMPRPLQMLSWGVVVCLVLAHIPGALAGRFELAVRTQHLPAKMALASAFRHCPELGGKVVVALNDPSIMLVPFDRAYRGQPLPRNIQLLVPGTIGFEVYRQDPTTLVLKAKDADLFDARAAGLMHASYALKNAMGYLTGGRTWKVGDRVARGGFLAEVLELSPRGAPRTLAFHFDKPLESPEMVWVYLDWGSLTSLPFKLPRVGEAVEVGGPVRR